MRKRLILFIASAMLLAMGYAQGFKNPVLPGFHADPSVCRAGDDFYLVNSTFQYFPGVPVFPSRRHFYVWTDNPAGEWSEPIVIDFAIGSCDPTLYWEDDKCYFLWKECGNRSRESFV